MYIFNIKSIMYELTILNLNYKQSEMEYKLF